MSAAGRPLRFLACLIGGWVCLRAGAVVGPAIWGLAMPVPFRPPVGVAMAQPSSTAGAQWRAGVRIVAPRRATVPAAPSRMRVSGPLPVRTTARPLPALRSRGGAPERGASMPGAPVRSGPVGTGQRPTGFGGASESPGRAAADDRMPAGPAMPGLSRREAGRRWSASLWMLWRPEAATGPAPLPLLGGSQAGMRIDRRLLDGRAGRLDVYGRLSQALVRPAAQEAALGLAWRPRGVPAALMVERRQRLGAGGRSGLSLLAAGGIGPRDIAPRVEIEGYAQAGLIVAPGADGFADGRLSLGYRLTPAAGRGALALGAGLSGSAQPGAARLDAGPELRLTLPLGDARLRLAAEWRLRVAGSARPASGPAVTLAGDF